MDQSRYSDLFRVTRTCQNGIAHVALAGELDLATVPTLEQHLAHAEQGPTSGVVLDMRELTFMDAAGLRCVLAAARRAAGNQHRFAVISVTGIAQKVFSLTGTEQILREAEGFLMMDTFAGAEPPGRTIPPSQPPLHGLFPEATRSTEPMPSAPGRSGAVGGGWPTTP